METKRKAGVTLFCWSVVMLAAAHASMAQKYVVAPSPAHAAANAAPSASLVLHIPTVLESSKEPYAGYYRDTALTACAQQVMPGGRLFTADTARALRDCMQSKSGVYRPAQTVSTPVQAPHTGLSAAASRETYAMQMKNDTAAHTHVKGSPPLKASKQAAPVTVARAAPPPPITPAPAPVAAAAPAAVRAPAQTVAASSKPAEARDSSASLFVPSGDSGPTPIFLH